MYTKLGWVPAGSIDRKDSPDPTLSLLTQAPASEIALLTPNSDNLLQSVERLWCLDSTGIKDCGKTSDDDLALSQFNKSIDLIHDRYTVGSPWKTPEAPELEHNFGLAFGRLKSLVRQFKDRPEMLQKYDEIIKDQLDKKSLRKSIPIIAPGSSI